MILTNIERRIRIAGVLIALALAIEGAGILWRHPLSFTLVHVLGLALFLVGAGIYLWSLLPQNRSGSE